MTTDEKLDRIIELLEQLVANTAPTPVIWPHVPYDDSGNWNPGGVIVTCHEAEVACCSCPPGDGSTCAGGTCCCTSDYVCDKCRSKND